MNPRPMLCGIEIASSGRILLPAAVSGQLVRANHTLVRPGSSIHVVLIL